jgi:hypothetical protein
VSATLGHILRIVGPVELPLEVLLGQLPFEVCSLALLPTPT